jgi:catechol 2,3-dioxygenase-like lactoylglutathione lyase family enzyme
VKPADLFHIGIVAEDLEATASTLSAVLGYEWTPVMGGPLEVTLPDGDAVLDIKCAYSTTLPRLEVVGAVPGSTLWQPTPGGAGVHHVGYWSDDVPADAAGLEEQGYVLEASRTLPGIGLFFTFHRSPTGFRVELVTRAAQPSMEAAFAISRDATS